MLRQKLEEVSIAIRLDDQAAARELISEIRSTYGTTYGDLQQHGIVYDRSTRSWTVAG